MRNPGDPLVPPRMEYQANKCEEHKVLGINQWKSELAIVVLKQGNACGAKGWQIDRA